MPPAPRMYARLVLALDLVTAPLVHAAPGDIDATFGVGGKVVGPLLVAADHIVADGIIQPDGRIIVVGASRSSGGDYAITLVRLLTDGTPDGSFGVGGVVTTPLDDGDDLAHAVTLQDDGRILVAGEADRTLETLDAGDTVVVRYLADGSLDPSFGSGGVVRTSFGPKVDAANALVVQPNGRIVVAGFAVSGPASRFALARYEADGSLDLTFGAGGTVTTVLRASDGINALALQPDGKLVVAGTSSTVVSSQPWDFAFARYEPDGDLDPTFGTGGVVIVESLGASAHSLNDVVLQPDGRIVGAGGISGGSVSPQFAVLRLEADGDLDPTFGTAGVMLTMTALAQLGVSALVQPDGHLIAAGSRYSIATDNLDFVLVRMDQGGGLDPGFGVGGVVATQIVTGYDTATAVRRQLDGKLVAMGQAYSGGFLAALTRYEGYPVACGNGVPEPFESCDDGGVTAGDGCDAGCNVEAGFACAGIPSSCTSGCGDGSVGGSEECDDGGSAADDGCDGTCRIEPGWTCTGGPSSCAAVCGDSRVVGSEQCDDGNTSAGDCCNGTCQAEAAGTPCLEEGDPCTNDTCGSGGVCQHADAPAATCLLPTQPGKAQLKIVRMFEKDQMQFKWTKGPIVPKATFGTPSAGAPVYGLCVYDQVAGTPSLAFGAVADGDGNCSDGACWTESGSGWRLKNKLGSPSGVIAVKLGQGLVVGRSKVQMKLKGQALIAPSLPLANDPAVVAQVRSSDGQCYGAVFSTPIANDGVTYRAKSD